MTARLWLLSLEAAPAAPDRAILPSSLFHPSAPYYVYPCPFTQLHIPLVCSPDFRPLRPLLTTSGVCQLFESELKKRNPQQRNITYDISDLHSFIDELGDCGCMVYEAEIQGYRPYNKDWIKAKVLKHLQRQA